MFHFLDDLGDGVDLCELCGGEGRVSTIAIRRRLKTGTNFDLVTHWDLNDPAQQRLVKKYFEEQQLTWDLRANPLASQPINIIGITTNQGKEA